nr:hypothetical protein [Aquitalea pelogenes]
MTHAYICDGIRTPFGRYGGALSSIRTDDLATIPIRALRERHPALDWSLVDELIYGCANQAGEDNRNIARMAGLLAGCPSRCPARPSTGCAVPAWTPLVWQRAALWRARPT